MKNYKGFPACQMLHAKPYNLSSLLDFKSVTTSHDHYKCNKECNQISEKAFLYGRHIPRKPDTGTHNANENADNIIKANSFISGTHDF